ncbi:MAG: SMP-30/gluconolactonase/LRE family protein [Planctomycetaceae bacterium]|nr:SMP-30/gluconolactonase/LRE family protein [Planctomycetaceae bacterium]MCB9951770.1 SMP-30/gluconolactonase/LRE family protein [Planctomycetaceae bacterium]
MRKLFATCLAVVACSALAWGANEYPLTEDSKPQEGVPQGEVKGPFEWNNSKIFPGTHRRYWVYVPAQYDASKPTCVLVVQDGLGRANGWKIPTVLDNLTHKGEVPPQIGIFIEPGVVPAANENAEARYNRSFEYDGLGDAYARFLLEEILPAVGKDYNLSTNPNDRAICGASSGAICAFNVAWERPDEFRRVYSTIGTYVGLRGGDAFPTLIRKYEPKPIRVFLQDGENDLNIYAGDWWNANQGMLSALKFSGYEVEHAWGEGGHDGKQSAAITPDAFRFLWKSYPEPIVAGHPPKRRTDVLIKGEGWELVTEGYKFTEGPAVNAKGELFFTDIPNGRIHKLEADGSVSVFAENSPGVNGLMFGPDGKLYACQNDTKKIVRYTEDGKEETVCEGQPSNDLVVLADGSGYFTDPNNSKLWRWSPSGEISLADEGVKKPNGVIMSPDQTLLNVADTDGRFTYSYQIQSDGKLAYKQRHGHLHVPDDTYSSGADGMTVDTLGRVYITTRVGLQITDQLGRVHLILTKPGPGWLSNCVFGGPDLDTLYVTCGTQLFKRKLNAKGIRPMDGPVKPPKPGL